MQARCQRRALLSEEEEGIVQEITLSSSSLSRSTVQWMGIAMCWDRVLLAGHLHNPLTLPLAKENQSISGQARGARLEANNPNQHQPPANHTAAPKAVLLRP